jgi:hypothetical protein
MIKSTLAPNPSAVSSVFCAFFFSSSPLPWSHFDEPQRPALYRQHRRYLLDLQLRERRAHVRGVLAAYSACEPMAGTDSAGADGAVKGRRQAGALLVVPFRTF